jgi:serum/glucocorticoid-regulated kinase 2
MLDYVLTLEKQRVAVLSVVQPLNLRIEQLSQLPGLPDNSLKRFNVIRCIGSGGFSKVFLAEVNGVYVALKVIDKEFLIQNDKEIIVENEKKILTELDHPFITKVHYTI